MLNLAGHEKFGYRGNFITGHLRQGLIVAVFTVEVHGNNAASGCTTAITGTRSMARAGPRREPRP